MDVIKRKSYPGFLKAIPVLLVLFFVFSNSLYADGTKQVSPGNGTGGANANGTAYFISPLTPQGSYPGSLPQTKLKVTILDHTIENIFSGFMARTFSNTSTTLVTNAYIRILDPTNTVVFQQLIPSSAAPGFISTYNQAWNGPNISGSNPSGYNPFNYNPTVNGEFTIELYRSNDGGTTADTATGNSYVTFPYFDISVAAGTSVIQGRLWSRNWSFITTDITSANFPNALASSFEGDFYAYTNDGFKALVNFQSGFRPLGFSLSMNFEGVANTGNYIADRASRNGTFTAPNTIVYPTIPVGYQLFLTNPDSTAFPNGTIGTPAITRGIYGCPGAYYIPYYSDYAGDIAITIDLNGTPGYQAGTADVILEAINVPAGNNVMPWNGLNGLGAIVPPSFSANVSVILFQGRINIPMIDAELNTNGLSASAIFPALGNRPLYWDDTNISSFGSGPNQRGICHPFLTD